MQGTRFRGGNMNEVSLAWAAGFFDGEGSIHGHGKYSTIYVGQKERDMLDFFQSIVVWGKVSNKRDYKTPGGTQTHMYTYYAGSDEGAIVLIKLLPYLRGRKVEAIRAVEGQIKRLGKRNHDKRRYNQLVVLYNSYKNNIETI